MAILICASLVWLSISLNPWNGSTGWQTTCLRQLCHVSLPSIFWHLSYICDSMRGKKKITFPWTLKSTLLFSWNCIIGWQTIPRFYHLCFLSLFCRLSYFPDSLHNKTVYIYSICGQWYALYHYKPAYAKPDIKETRLDQQKLSCENKIRPPYCPLQK